MKTAFANWAKERAAVDSAFVFLTADLGFNAFEPLAAALGPRFLNVGVAEQNLVALAAGMAREGLRPFAYSIASFAVFRAAEMLRLDCGQHGLPVAIVGNGGGFQYGVQGPTHHGIEDLAVVTALPGFQAWIPVAAADVAGACDALAAETGPTYLRLSDSPETSLRLPPFSPLRKLRNGRRLTIAALGPSALAAEEACRSAGIEADLFAVAQLPFRCEELVASVQATGELWVVEEHVARGGLGEWLSRELGLRGVAFRMEHVSATSRGAYGSAAYLRREAGLDAPRLAARLRQRQRVAGPSVRAENTVIP